MLQAIKNSGVLLAALLFTTNAISDISIRPNFITGVGYDNNLRTQPGPPTEVYVATNDILVNTIFSRPTYNVSVRPRIRVSRYTDDSELDAEDYFFRLSGTKLLRRFQFSGEFNFERESSITTERSDARIFNANIPRTTFSLDTSALYAFSNRLRFTVFFNALDAKYKEDPRSQLIDYGSYGLGGAVNYDISDRTTFLTTLYVSDFKAPQLGTSGTCQ